MAEKFKWYKLILLVVETLKKTNIPQRANLSGDEKHFDGWILPYS